MSEVQEPSSKAKARKAQPQQPGVEAKMVDKPIFIRDNYRGSGKLTGKVALITGGDSGIGRAAAVHFAREGASVAVVYLNEKQDAEETLKLIEAEGAKGLVIDGDVGDDKFCKSAVEKTIEAFARLDILVNNAAEQHTVGSFTDLKPEQIRKTFRTNIEGYFYMALAALEKMGEGGSIINTTSVTAYRGSTHLIDYSATKGAIASFTRSLALSVVDKKIRVNGVAPGPIWTPLIPATFRQQDLAEFGKNTPMGRPGQPAEVGPCYVFLAGEDASYMTGQIIHVNGGDFVTT